MAKTLFERLLEFYEIDENTYKSINFNVDENNFLEGHNFSNVKDVSGFVKNAIDQNKKIFIYGDYDADGIMGTSILVKMFSYINVHVDYYIPSRYLDGYGLTLNKSIEIVEKGYGLVITVDNGISAFEPIKYLKDHGVNVVILDHHSTQETLPYADKILHPTVSNLGEISTSGAMVAFIFSLEFLGRFDKYLSTLASVSIVSDMMPLKLYNRNLLRLVFGNYVNGEFLQFDLLKEDEPYNETTIGMKIAPKINAVGRLIENTEVNNVVQLFVSENREKILNYIDWLNNINEERKNISKECIESVPEIDSKQKFVIYKTDIKEGLLGLVANHICSKYQIPTIVLTLDNSGTSYKGSCRAPEGFNVVDAFNEIKDTLSAFGGHALAGGCTVSVDQFDKFYSMFEEYCASHPIVKPIKKTIPFGLIDISLDNYNLIKSFSPFGENWPTPLLLIEHINTYSLRYSKTNEHILSPIGQSSRITGFNFSKEYVSQYQFIDITGNLRINSYKGYNTTEFLIKTLSKSEQ